MYGIQFSPKVNHARLACTKQKTSLPLRRAERSVCLSKDGASGLGKYLGHDLPAVRALLLGVEVHINGTCRRKAPEPVQGVQIPALIFVSANSSAAIPHPLSSMHSHRGSFDMKPIRTSVAPALILLSTISATAASNRYPIDLVDSTRIGAKGITILSSIRNSPA